MTETMPQELTIDALRMAIAQRHPDPGLLHRSDRSSQHAARAYRRLLEENGMRCSMSRKDNYWDNAPMESFFGSMKAELDIDDVAPETRRQAKAAIFGFPEPPIIDVAGIRRSAIAQPTNENRSQRPRRS